MHLKLLFLFLIVFTYGIAMERQPESSFNDRYCRFLALSIPEARGNKKNHTLDLTNQGIVDLNERFRIFLQKNKSVVEEDEDIELDEYKAGAYRPSISIIHFFLDHNYLSRAMSNLESNTF